MFDQTAPPTYTPVTPVDPATVATPVDPGDMSTPLTPAVPMTQDDGFTPPNPYQDQVVQPVVPAPTDWSPPATTNEPQSVSDTLPDDLNQPLSNSQSDSAATPTPSSPPSTESLEDQNIFYLLGVTDGTEEQKNEFLDELQQVIWEDFLDEDVKLLLTQEELAELDTMKAAKPTAKLEEQEEVIVYLEKLIPDLEDILLEKALELKADLVKERIAGMRELHKEQPTALASLDQAERLVQEEKWLSAAQMLNSIPA